MDTTETRLEAEPKRDSRGRKIISDVERTRLIAEYEAGGLTQREFCRRQGVNYHTFVAWRGRLGKKPTQAQAQGGRIGFVETIVPLVPQVCGSARTPGAVFELDLGGGLVVRTGDDVALVRLISQLRG